MARYIADRKRHDQALELIRSPQNLGYAGWYPLYRIKEINESLKKEKNYATKNRRSDILLHL